MEKSTSRRERPYGAALKGGTMSKFCPACNGPYDHSEGMCQGDYGENWLDENGNYPTPEELETCENETCCLANGGCDCGGDVEARFWGENK